MYMGYFDLLLFKVILGSFGAVVSKWPVSEMAGHGAIRSEIWDSQVVVTCICGNFYLLVFKVTLRSFGALVSKLLLTQKHSWPWSKT